MGIVRVKELEDSRKQRYGAVVVLISPRTNSLTVETIRIAYRIIRAHWNHRLRNPTSERMNAVAATMPKIGKAIGPYATTHLVVAGKTISKPLKSEPTLAVAEPSQQNAIRNSAAMAQDFLRIWMRVWLFTAICEL
jgi:hypothetical protein